MQRLENIHAVEHGCGRGGRKTKRYKARVGGEVLSGGKSVIDKVCGSGRYIEFESVTAIKLGGITSLRKSKQGEVHQTMLGLH
ncbi:hypothetical protein PSHT_06050 [Puccinia striiformis]|uniref:Uncharacterized protein n=3 Tax=Puccinia striiformis TaxID=27350 RepID=A0A0L0V803_9BASI|nr:hypothetical protein H4Q26_005882 [Puccinia striiformis f. sp. tritici PST-130]KNE95435.1 hypothetical protein PSTG_11288 [Puccinia striiformis f. sp. tritici PST-78]POW10601.1 hypothetical protein PSTT_05970 [Puccinia striiformis]POW18187.1 hypothetical protein PSHT_06050 [Puccinia striiformis]